MTQLEFHFSSGSSSQAELIGFLDSQNELSHSVLSEYPSVFSKENQAESLWVEVQGKVVSHVACVVRQFRHPLYHFPIGLVGSVATDPEFRGLGLATSLMRQALESLKAKGCALAALWSSNTDFYSPIGFFPGGFEVELGFESRWEGPTVSSVSVLSSSEEVSQLWKLYNEHGFGLSRSLEQFQQLLTVPKVRCLVRREQDQIVAYALLNKGSDFTDVIHEWAGPVKYVADIVGFLKSSEYADRFLRVISPAHKNLLELESRCQRSSLDAMGLLKVLDRPALRSIYLTHLRNAAIACEWGQELQVAGKTIPVETDEDFIAAVFGSGAETRRQFDDKLPFFIWGLDSV